MGGVSETPVSVWGVLNVTPDSFSDGGRFVDADAAVVHGVRMIGEGATVIDVGGESSRPAGRTYGAGAQHVPADEELRRVLPVVDALVARGARVSIDTVKADVASAALAAGASIVNDVSTGRERALLEVVAGENAELVLMHNRGRGEVEGDNIAYEDVVADVLRELGHAVERAVDAGVDKDRIWLDPGIGFAKTAAQSLRLLAATDAFVATGHRVLVGPSRKSFIAATVPDADGSLPGPGERLGGTIAAAVLAVQGGAHAVRVHDVAAVRQGIRLVEEAGRAR